ncbi:hypothetical protein [Desulfonatronum sp. SC1]|uniref:hypothetical protein n=1 Tax=Desulfonatronum sp. SC1 TaxID=2109626 RepID=UPI000D306721|nr:hypothetical protein [Desulfonatronum sp. SC1]PTN37910.1 hypothetical protein C6366_05130 [Desulfonatronum sp. SC1]
MKDFSFREVLGLMGKTAPFLLFRFLVYFGITLGFVLVTGIGAGIGYGVGSIAKSGAGGGMVGGLIGFGIASTVMYLIREYLLYIVKAGHIAVLVEVVEGGTVPGGKGQIAYAQEKVRERFVESSLLFGLDQLVKGILRAFNRTFLTVAAFLPIPGTGGLVKLINMIVNLSLTYLDEVILAYLMKTRAENPWASSRTALVLYAQNYVAFLKNAAWLALFIWAMTFAVFLVVLGPAALIVSIFPGAGGPLTLLVALVLAWGIKQAVIEPIGMTALMQVFFKVTKGQVANPEWEAKLEGVSTKFHDLAEKAKDWNRDKTASQTSEV